MIFPLHLHLISCTSKCFCVIKRRVNWSMITWFHSGNTLPSHDLLLCCENIKNVFNKTWFSFISFPGKKRTQNLFGYAITWSSVVCKDISERRDGDCRFYCLYLQNVISWRVHFQQFIFAETSTPFTSKSFLRLFPFSSGFFATRGRFFMNEAIISERLVFILLTGRVEHQNRIYYENYDLFIHHFCYEHKLKQRRGSPVYWKWFHFYVILKEVPATGRRSGDLLPQVLIETISKLYNFTASCRSHLK